MLLTLALLDNGIWDQILKYKFLVNKGCCSVFKFRGQFTGLSTPVMKSAVKFCHALSRDGGLPLALVDFVDKYPGINNL